MQLHGDAQHTEIARTKTRPRCLPAPPRVTPLPSQTELTPTGETADLADYVNASVSRMGTVPISGLGKLSLAVDPDFEPRGKQPRVVIGDRVRLEDYDEYVRDEFLAEACPAVETNEPFTLEDLVAAGDRTEQERKALEAGLEEVEKSLTRDILGVVENVAGYVGSLFKVSPAEVYVTKPPTRM